MREEGREKRVKGTERGERNYHLHGCSGVARNFNWDVPGLPSLPFPSPFHLSSLPVFPLSLPSFPLKVGPPKIQLGWDSQNRIWCILALKMRSGGNSFDYYPWNKLTKLANLVQLKRTLMFCRENWGPAPPLSKPLHGSYNLTALLFPQKKTCNDYCNHNSNKNHISAPRGCCTPKFLHVLENDQFLLAHPHRGYGSPLFFFKGGQKLA